MKKWLRALMLLGFITAIAVAWLCLLPLAILASPWIPVTKGTDPQL
jgi:uncharacterized membrane protein required for colicin V production